MFPRIAMEVINNSQGGSLLIDLRKTVLSVPSLRGFHKARVKPGLRSVPTPRPLRRRKRNSQRHSTMSQ
jgi:hypothetical protein